MIRTKRSNSDKMITSINITPFTDVVLVVLIIFMVTATTTLMSKDPRSSTLIDLPQEIQKQTLVVSKLTLTLTKDGRVFLNDEDIPVPEAQLVQRLTAEQKKDNIQTLVLNADRNVAYEKVNHILVVAGQAGIAQIAPTMVTPERTTPAGATVP